MQRESKRVRLEKESVCVCVRERERERERESKRKREKVIIYCLLLFVKKSNKGTNKMKKIFANFILLFKIFNLSSNIIIWKNI
jgi:hypothetical protein